MCAPPFKYQTVETMDSKNFTFLHESHATTRNSPGPGASQRGRMSLRKDFTVLATCQNTLQERLGATLIMGLYGQDHA